MLRSTESSYGLVPRSHRAMAITETDMELTAVAAIIGL
jgi:hypothetical protein